MNATIGWYIHHQGRGHLRRTTSPGRGTMVDRPRGAPLFVAGVGCSGGAAKRDVVNDIYIQ